MKKAFLWFWMLTKRLYKKPTFVAILILIPLLVLCYNAASRADSGMITVALAQQDDDVLAARVVQELSDSSQLLRCVVCDSAQRAEELVRLGKADTAWILHEGFTQKLEAFVASPTARNAFVTVLVREDTVLLKLSREKLSGAMYALYAKMIATDFVRENIPGLSHVSDGTLAQYYENTFDGTELFVYDETDPASANAQNTHYLTAPVRGLLAVVIVLCGMASGMYWQEDLRRGTFGWLSGRGKCFAELGCQMVALVNVAAVVLVALYFAGMTASLGAELAAMGLYVLCVAAFCAALRRLCASLRVLGTLLPLLVVMMLVICPVFFDLGPLRGVQYLLPPTYYLNGVFDKSYLLGLAAYGAGSLGVYFLLGAIRRDLE